MNKIFGYSLQKGKVVSVSLIASVFATILAGVVLVNGSGEPLFSSGYNSSGQFGIATTSPGSNLSVLGSANLGVLTIEGVLKASSIVATSSLIVRDTSGVRLRDTDGSNCHKVTVNSGGAIAATLVNCDTGASISTADSFDSYSSGSLDGKNGGTDFLAAWVKNNTGDFAIQTSGCQSGNCIADNSGGDTRDYRTFTAQASGSGSVYIKRTQNEVNNFEIGVCASGTTNCEGAGKFRFSIPRLSPFNIVLKSGGTDATLGQYSNLTWQKIDFEWGAGQSQNCAAGQVAARFAGGSWSGCKDMNSGNDPGTISFVTDDTAIGGADEFWIDELEL